jgi:hypothetical protein
MSTVISKNVQIGADGTASNNFTAYQPATPDGTLRIGNGNSGSVTDAITLTSAGNVGIGTSSPTAGSKLHVSGGDIRITDTYPTLYLEGSVGGKVWSFLEESTGNLSIRVDAAPKVTIDTSGNVGIGTSTLYPSAAHSLASQLRVGLQGNYFSQNGAGLGISGAYFIDNAYLKNSIGNFAYITSAKASAITVDAGSIYFKRSSGTDVADTAASLINAAVINAYGMGLGASVPSSGTGITFPVTQSASSDANTLDDYEEGTWTAAFTAASGTITINASYNTGTYIKVGGLVSIMGDFVVSSVSSPTGALRITGLPFTNPNNTRNSIGVAIWADALETTATAGLQALVFQGTSTILIRQLVNGIAADRAASCKAGSTFRLSATYSSI